MTTMQRPLAFTAGVLEDWDEDDGYEAFFILKLNGVEICREKTVYGSGADDAEEWARGLAFKVLDMDWSKAVHCPHPMNLHYHMEGCSVKGCDCAAFPERTR